MQRLPCRCTLHFVLGSVDFACLTQPHWRCLVFLFSCLRVKVLQDKWHDPIRNLKKQACNLDRVLRNDRETYNFSSRQPRFNTVHATALHQYESVRNSEVVCTLHSQGYHHSS